MLCNALYFFTSLLYKSVFTKYSSCLLKSLIKSLNESNVEVNNISSNTSFISTINDNSIDDNDFSVVMGNKRIILEYKDDNVLENKIYNNSTIKKHQNKDFINVSVDLFFGIKITYANSGIKLGVQPPGLSNIFLAIDLLADRVSVKSKSTLTLLVSEAFISFRFVTLIK